MTAQLLKDVVDALSLPRVDINLMYEKTTDNDPFFSRVVKRFYNEAMSLHPKLPFVRKYRHGFALCQLPDTFEAYLNNLDSSARRNYRKAERLGYHVRRFEYNAHLGDIRDIWISTPIRQGELLPEEIREGQVQPITDPPSRTPYHDYVYQGVVKEAKVFAYTACLIMGEICHINDIYGHAAYLKDGIVPMVIIETAREIKKHYPAVKYYGYGTYFGASESMRRFKRKFLFQPHRAHWILQTS